MLPSSKSCQIDFHSSETHLRVDGLHCLRVYWHVSGLHQWHRNKRLCLKELVDLFFHDILPALAALVSSLQDSPEALPSPPGWLWSPSHAPQPAGPPSIPGPFKTACLPHSIHFQQRLGQRSRDRLQPKQMPEMMFLRLSEMLNESRIGPPLHCGRAWSCAANKHHLRPHRAPPSTP